MSAVALDLLARAWRDLGGDADALSRVAPASSPVPLPARTDVADLAWAAVAAASLAAAEPSGGAVALDPAAVATAFTSERVLRIDGRHPQVWSPLSRYWHAADDWVRTHGNYPHHAAMLRQALGLGPAAGPDDISAVIASLPAEEVVRRIEHAHGLCVAVEHEHPAVDVSLRRMPLVEYRRIGPGSPRPVAADPVDAPLRGMRVLDLTRVIAGPVATRTLALLGADVLRLDPANLPEHDWQHLDTGHGKRSALIDLTSPRGRARLHELLADADAVVTGYRPNAAARLGLDPGDLAQSHPGLVMARLSAWGFAEDDLDRRGFDSLVQAASGIAWVEAGPDADAPAALPAQALDHSAGYLLAAGIVRARMSQLTDGGSWLIAVSLRRIAAELLGLPRSPEPAPTGAWDPAGHVQEFDVAGRSVVTAAPAIAYDGGPTSFAAPRPWGEDEPAWD